MWSVWYYYEQMGEQVFGDRFELYVHSTANILRESFRLINVHSKNLCDERNSTNSGDPGF